MPRSQRTRLPTVCGIELRKGFAAWYQRWYGVELNPNGNTAFNRFEGRYPPCHAGFRQSGRTGIGTNPDTHLYFFEQNTRREVINYDLKEEDGWMPDFEALEKMDLEPRKN